MSPITPQPYKDPVPVPGLIQLDPSAPNLENNKHLHAKAAQVSIHSDWPLTDVWRYEADPKATVHLLPVPAGQPGYTYAGPTLVVEGGSPSDKATAQPFDVIWHNDIFSGDHHAGTRYPVAVDYRFHTPSVPGEADPKPQPETTNAPGRSALPLPPLDPMSPLSVANHAVMDRFAAIDKLPSALVAHVHGGETEADSDGWTDNVKLHGQSQQGNFRHAQRACMLWYHDHAMGVTRLNVMAGLAGLILVRDDRDRLLRRALADEHGFPPGEDFMTYSPHIEVPLLIQDRNFELEDPITKKDTARLLHKTRKDLMEFFGPYTLVNGKLWPKLVSGKTPKDQTVRPLHYRLRFINGASARTFALRFVIIEGERVVELPPGSVVQIGTDQGPLTLGPKDEMGVDFSQAPLILAPAERADLIVDLTHCAGKKIRVLNLATAPFSGVIVDLPPTHKPLDEALPDGMLPYFDVMEFDVGSEPAPKHPFTLKREFFAPIDSTPLASLKPCTGPGCCVPGHDHSATPMCVHTVRRLLLVEDDPTFPNTASPDDIAEPAMLSLYELVETECMVPDHHSPTHQRPCQDTDLLPAGFWRFKDDVGPTVYCTVGAKLFNDQVNWHVEHNSVEEWRIYNVSADTHPVHVHLVGFEVVNRANYIGFGDQTFDTDKKEWSDWSIINENNVAASDLRQRTLVFDKELDREPTEILGRKDTVRANPGSRDPKSGTPDPVDSTDPNHRTGVFNVEMTAIRMQFTGHCGRYMYHCHILEHEDHEMMRPFVVLPASLLAQMPGHSGHGHGGGHSHAVPVPNPLAGAGGHGPHGHA